MTSSLGRTSVSMAWACSIVGRTLVLTSVARASRRSPVLRKTRNIASRTPACNATATAVNATKTVILSIKVAPSGYAKLGLEMDGRVAVPFLADLSRDFSGPQSPRWLRDTPAVPLHKRHGTVLSAGLPHRGRDRPIAKPDRVLHGHGCGHNRGLLRRGRESLPASRCRNAAHIIRRPMLPNRVPLKTKQCCCRRGLT